MITILDYGMGNLGSIQNMFKRLGYASRLSCDLEVIDSAEKILLPGVGAFDAAMQRINNIKGLREMLQKKALGDKIPVMGICLGMQLLTDGSEEGNLPGLGLIAGKAHHFKGRIGQELKIPHMGWNLVDIQQKNAITEGFEGETRFYFVHSYFVTVQDEQHSLMKTNYGLQFDSAIMKDNIIGAQFHPEKSHKFGMQLFENFAKL